MENIENGDKLNTTKVLSAIDKLENHLSSLTGTAAEGTTARLQELSRLKTEHRQLKLNQKEATKRLDSLIKTIEKSTA